MDSISEIRESRCPSQKETRIWHLQTFGKIGIMTKPATKKIKAKLEDRGRPGMFVGYADNHASHVYHIMNLQMMIASVVVTKKRSMRVLNSSRKVDLH
jgi:hypothetical protein